MATVVLSNAVKQAVFEKISAKFSARKDAVEKEMLANGTVELLYRTFVPEEIENTARSLPPDIVHYASHMYFTIENHRMDASLSSSRPLPSELSSSYGAAARYDLLKRTDLNPELKSRFTTFVTARKQIADEHEKLKAELEALFSKCRTLQQVVEVWASVLDFCPSDVINRYNAPQKKRFKAKDHELAVDTKVALAKMRIS